MVTEFYSNDFIGVWDNVFDKDFCTHMINTFDSSKFIDNRNRPHVYDKQYNLQAYAPIESNYLMQGVEECFVLYVEKYPFLKQFDFVSGCILMQKTEPFGGGYHVFHAEDTSWESSQRTLAWSVYFNDLVDSGETEFLYQGYKISPKLGRVAIWPGSFTHLHRGNPVNKNKYIATGWFTCDFGLRSIKFNSVSG